MQQQLTNLSPDLKRLLDEGYEFEVSGGHLLVHHIPYVTSTREIKYGVLVCTLTLASPNKTGTPQDHTIFFCGDTPCNADGSPMIAIINNSNTMQLTENIKVNHLFSSKPVGRNNYSDYYEKIMTYSEILSVQAKAIDNSVITKPNRRKAA